MGSNHIFILDGHNIIFAIPGLHRLQTSGRRAEARAELTERLERFAEAKGGQVLVVFDGGGTEHAVAVRAPAVRVAYAPAAGGGADERILREARRCLDRGLGVTVVTDDRHTLANRLPPGARWVAVREFWLRHIEPPPAAGDKRIEGDFSDLEREMLARAAAAEPAGAGRPPLPPTPGRRTPARTLPGAGGPVAGGWVGAGPEGDAGERLRRKRERGRRRQERRLGRRTGRGSGPGGRGPTGNPAE